jgi:hypothetical protein
MRPSFVVTVNCHVDDAMGVLQGRIEKNSEGVEASLSKHHGILRVCGEKQRFWSPCLDLTVRDASEPSSTDSNDSNGMTTKVWGTFSPRSEIWTGFVFAIGTCLISSLFAFIFSFAQIMLGRTPWALLIPADAMLVAVGIYASALVGQGLSADEMYRIRRYVDTCLLQAEETSLRRAPQTTDVSSQL